ncbi:Sulfite exporter TauE/SafE [Pseudomonas sp. THAF187a]|uniref:sulfite exporter TauE/SafE family protein n=1 Tax=unclassified Pseudomonas TaxID=196821 RepID=UPI001268AE7E|nr:MULTISPECIES: sulfite exporter TauE/SafE family protein [unclassified Pseudomonas]QFT22343.1 Sulfite exporter TauE/SafE [Pseudomonas sp. THAF187a]QFT42530.1 Sulfite exporter TauE/SafE [Pseudomonas sp. THAF42]
MSLIDLLLNLVLGAALGTVGGLFGIGGGLIAIPVLGVLYGLDQQLAQGTALVMVVPNVMLAIWRYNQRNRIDLRHALLLGITSLVCAWLASLYAVELDSRTMRWAFIGFLLALAAYNLVRMMMAQAPSSSELRHPWGWFGVLGGVSGAMGGLFGVGGAVVATPVLTSVFGTTQVVAQGLSLSLALPSTGVTLLTYALHEHVNWWMGVPLAVGGLLSISWGVRLAHSLPERLLRSLFCVFLLICALMLGLEASGL